MNLIRILLFLSIVFVSGCINSRSDITKNDSLWLPYKRGAVYLLTKDVFLIQIQKGENLEPSRLALVPPSNADRGSGYYDSPKDIKDYLDDPEKAITKNYGYFTDKIVVRGIVKNGTRFTPSVLKKNAGISLWAGRHSNVTQYGKLLDGNFVGATVELSDVSWDFSEPKKLSKFVMQTENAK